MLTPANVGGYMQGFLQAGNPQANVRVIWSRIIYEDLGTVATSESSWGRVKALFDN